MRLFREGCEECSMGMPTRAQPLPTPTHSQAPEEWAERLPGAPALGMCPLPAPPRAQVTGAIFLPPAKWRNQGWYWVGMASWEPQQPLLVNSGRSSPAQGEGTWGLVLSAWCTAEEPAPCCCSSSCCKNGVPGTPKSVLFCISENKTWRSSPTPERNAQALPRLLTIFIFGPRAPRRASWF